MITSSAMGGDHSLSRDWASGDMAVRAGPDEERVRIRLTTAREASRAGSCPAGCRVLRNATSAVVSAGTEIFAVGGHVAAALNYLANELVFGLNQMRWNRALARVCRLRCRANGNCGTA